MFQSMIKLPKLLKILGVIFLTATLTHAQPLPNLTNAQWIQILDNELVRQLQEDSDPMNHAPKSLVATACAISGHYVNKETIERDVIANIQGDVLAKKLLIEYNMFPIDILQDLTTKLKYIIWGSREGVIKDNRAIYNHYKKCLNEKISMLKSQGILDYQAQSLVKIDFVDYAGGLNKDTSAPVAIEVYNKTR